jgi:hypothetical protein
MIVKGEIGGDKFTGEIVDEMPNGNVHINVFETENNEWKRDLERGFPVLISVKKTKIITA